MNQQNLIKNLATAYLEKKNLKFKIYGKNLYLKKSIVCISSCTSWKDMRRYIDSIITSDFKVCLICTEENKQTVGCNRCSKRTCINCYINIFKANDGVSKCSFCNHSYGCKIPDYLMPLAIMEIKSNAGIL